MFRTGLLFFVSVFLLAACGGKDEAPGVAGPSTQSLPGVYQGTFPCGNCPGIETTLWLRPDRRFLIEQRYLPGELDSGEALVAHGLGRWRWDEDSQSARLTGAGPDRIFDRPDADTLLMQSAASSEHRLRRSAAIGASFAGPMRMNGVVARSGDQLAFAECLSGLEAPIQKTGDYASFWRQFRSIVPSGGVAPVELAGHFRWAADGSAAGFVIDEFVRLQSGTGC